MIEDESALSSVELWIVSASAGISHLLTERVVQAGLHAGLGEPFARGESLQRVARIPGMVSATRNALEQRCS